MRNLRTSMTACILAVFMAFGTNVPVMAAGTNVPKVKNVKVSDVRQNRMTLKWSKVKGASKYQVKYGTNKKLKAGTVKTAGKNKLTVKKLKAGKKYYFKVRAVNKAGKKGKWSVTVNKKTKNNEIVVNNASQTHTHDWIRVEGGYWKKELVKAAWTEEVPVYTYVYRSFCNGCGEDITDDITAHMKPAVLAGRYECGGYTNKPVRVQTGTETVEHPAEYRDVWVSVITYQCAYCDAEK